MKTNPLIPQNLPRKLKKALYGTKGNRKSLAIALIENKKFIKVTRMMVKYTKVNLDYLNKIPITNTDKDYTWNIQTKNNDK